VTSIVNGLFAGRSGISSHGSAIAVVGDNISNSSTIGYKSARAEFEDLIAGNSTSGKTIGSGSSLAAVSTIFGQGTLEFTGRPVDGNGYFVVAKDAQRFYTRAGNFKVSSAGNIVDQNDLAVLGFPANGSGALEPININTIEQDSVATGSVTISGNLNASEPVLVGAILDPGPANVAPPTVTYAQLNEQAEFSTVVDVFDSLGESHTVTVFYYKTDTTEWTVRMYANNEDVDQGYGAVTLTGRPRQVGTDITLNFEGDGRPTAATVTNMTATIDWNNSADNSVVEFNMTPFTQYSASSTILSISQDGKGVGAITSLSIGDDGQISALLSNGQSAVIGTVGMVNFSNAEGLSRVGKNLLQQSQDSGEPIVGRPTTGTFGAVKSGSLELSTVDIASEFVKLITLQRGFQANSRIITTINGLLNEIIQLA
jgi:flagellar hook protein FlgE